MAEYITKEEAVQELYKVSHRLSDPPIDTTENEIIKVLHSLMHKIEQIPAANVIEVKHGYWKPLPAQSVTGTLNVEAECSNCGREVVYQIVNNRYEFENFCPHCGVKMRGESNEREA